MKRSIPHCATHNECIQQGTKRSTASTQARHESITSTMPKLVRETHDQACKQDTRATPPQGHI